MSEQKADEVKTIEVIAFDNKKFARAIDQLAEAGRKESPVTVETAMMMLKAATVQLVKPSETVPNSPAPSPESETDQRTREQ